MLTQDISLATPKSSVTDAKKTRSGYYDKHLLYEFIRLTKPTITLLVVVTVIPSLLLSTSGWPSLLPATAALLGAGLMSASAAVFNQLLEIDIDQNMTRTKSRGLASGRLSQTMGAGFGLLLGTMGTLILWIFGSVVAAISALAGHLLYVFVYTLWLKKRTSQNIVLGGAAGCVGPLIGWSAITGELALGAWLQFLIIFIWTPPHFWALSLKYQDEYKKAGIPMYPVVHGDHKTRQAIFFYTLLLFPAIGALYLYSYASLLCSIIFISLTARFSYLAYSLYQDGHNQKSMPVFYYSCLYAFAIFVGLALDAAVLKFLS